MDNLKIFTFMVPVYGRLVAGGKYTLDPTDMSKKQVPERYIELVSQWLAENIDKLVA